MTINERIFKLIDSKKKSKKEFAEYIGTTPQVVNNWNTRGTNPPSEYIYKIAEYFNTSTDYILTGQIDQEQFSQEEKLLVKYYRHIPGEQKSVVMNAAAQFYNSQPKGLSSDTKIG